MTEEGNYCSEAFIEELRKVVNHLLPVAALLTHETYKRRASNICAYYGGEEYKEEIFQDLGQKVARNLHKLAEIEDEDDFFRWASTVAKHKSIDVFRRDGKHSQRGVRDERPVDEHIDIADTAPGPYLEYAIKEWIASLTHLQRRIYQIYAVARGDDPKDHRKISSRKVSKILAKEGIDCSHTTVAKEWRELRRSCLEMLGRIGTRKRAQAGST